jgi:hypothetical protein
MTRTGIGDFLGLTIETVSRAFSKLKALVLIDLPESNRVKLLNINALERLAEGKDSALLRRPRISPEAHPIPDASSSDTPSIG